jgi:hypothetical protein
MKRNHILLFVIGCALLLFYPLSLTHAESSRYPLQITTGSEHISKVVEVRENQDLVVTFANDIESIGSLTLTVSSLINPTSPIGHFHLAKGHGKGIKLQPNPGCYRVEVSCLTKDCNGAGSIVVKDQ